MHPVYRRGPSPPNGSPRPAPARYRRANRSPPARGCGSVRRVPASIPVEVADITADWLEEALAAHATGASVQVIEVAEAHEGTTGRARVLLTHDDPRLPRSVFVKLAPFYSEIAADVPVRHPRPWYAAHDDARRYIMVLEDLTAAGARYPNQHNNDLPEFVEATIDAFAAPHAAFWESPRFAADGDLAWVCGAPAATALRRRS